MRIYLLDEHINTYNKSQAVINAHTHGHTHAHK